MAATIMSGVWHVANSVEHSAADAGQNSNEGEEGPELSVHDPGAENGPDDVPEGHNSEETDATHYPSEPVGRPMDFRVRTARQVACEPVADRLGRGRTIVSVRSWSVPILGGRETNPAVKSNRRGSTLETANLPVEGWNRSRTGAVCRPSCSGEC